MKKIIAHFTLPLLALFGLTSGVSVAQNPGNNAETGTLETLIVASGTVAMNVDVNRLNGIAGGTKSPSQTLRFQAAPDSFLPVLVFNNELRGPTPGSVVLIPENSALLPAALNASFNQLVLQKFPGGDLYEMALRDAKTGFNFFSIEGSTYQYDAGSRSFQLKDGRLLLSQEFAKTLGRPAEAGAVVGTISMSAVMRTIELQKMVNGTQTSAVLPPTPSVSGTTPPEAVAVSNGPDVIVGDMPSMVQSGSAGTQVGLAVATTSCNAGNVELNWFALPNTDHPVIPQGLYRMSGGATNSDRFEQVGQGWMKHAFTALQQTTCGACTSAANGTHLGVGCSDPYDTGLNGSQTGIGSRAWANPFTGAYPSTARDHTGHTHTGTSHRVLIEQSDLNTTLNPGATYYAETQYVTPHEYAWCQSHAGECNMYNNASYRRFNVTGTTSFSFSAAAATVRTQPAIQAWTGATISNVEPAPAVPPNPPGDGRAFVAYKVSGPAGGVYHYEYAVYNQNLDRSIQSFSVPLGCGVSLSNIGFHAPLNGPGFANDGTLNSAGFSNAPWTPNQTAATSMSWNCETFAQNQNANAIRWGTTYNFRFDSTRPPQAANATVGFYKTGAPIMVAIQAPTPDVCAPFQMSGVVSRKVHGAAGTFDIDISSSDAVECRSGGANGDHTFVFTFSNNVVSGNATVSPGAGSVAGSPSFSGNTMTVNLTGVTDLQKITVNLTGVTDQFAQTLPNSSVGVNMLLGDTSGNKSVNGSDVSQTKAASGVTLDGTNFRTDVNVSGGVSGSDISQVKAVVGHTLP